MRLRRDNLLVVQQPRSSVLADAFTRLGLVERTGRGVNRMFDVMLRAGRDVPDYGRTTAVAVVASTAVGRADTDFVRFVLGVEDRDQRSLSLSELLTLRELRRSGPLGVDELEQVTQQARPRVLDLLADLRERGLVEARGDGRGRNYHLSAAVYRQLGRPAAYQRVRGFEGEQQRQLVLAHVRAHGSVSQGQVGELCTLGPRQASHLLATMVASGLLQQQGERRWTRYVLPGTAEGA